jgi:hypothetical protein
MRTKLLTIACMALLLTGCLDPSDVDLTEVEPVSGLPVEALRQPVIQTVTNGSDSFYVRYNPDLMPEAAITAAPARLCKSVGKSVKRTQSDEETETMLGIVHRHRNLAIYCR